MKIFTFNLFFVLMISSLFSQPFINWQKSFGGSDHEYCWKTIPTSDGGYAFTGFSDSNDGHVNGQNNGETDLWVAKVNAAGTIEWSYLYGGSDNDEGYDIIQLSDGSYMVVGYTDSHDGDVTGHHGTNSYSDVWLLKLNSNGTLNWNKCYGGTDDDEGMCIGKTQAGDFIIGGTTYSNDGDVSGNHGSGYGDLWILKINASGNILLQKCVGGSDFEELYSLYVTSDNGCIVGGRTNSTDGDAIGFHGGSDMIIAKLTPALGLEWSKCYGGSQTEECNEVIQINDGSYAALGYCSTHNNGDVTGHHGSQGSDDFWLLKLTATGTIDWAKCFGGDGDDQANGLTATSDGGYIMCGLTNSTNGDVSGFHSGGWFDPDVWVAKVTSSGNLVWQRCCGGSGQDESFNVFESGTNQYTITGFTYSADYDVTQNFGSADGWIINLNGSSGIAETIYDYIDIYPNPFRNEIILSVAKNLSFVEKVVITDLSGKELDIIRDFGSINSKRIVTENLKAGMYFIIISGKDFRIMEKVLKE